MPSGHNRNLRNIAIIAHVDHGKTTLVDAMFRQSGLYRDNETVTERVMDSNDLEREKGITIFSKHASVLHDGIKINIVDTPGHSDFGSEVERVLNMVDGVLLLVDAFEGPMPQTRFVLRKALGLGLKPVVVLNKIDRPGARPDTVLDLTFDLFCELNASDSQLDFPVIYASARNGTATADIKKEGVDLSPLFDTIISHVPAPEVRADKDFLMQVTQTEYDNYLGPLAIGRIRNGSVNDTDAIWLLSPDGTKKNVRLTRLFVYAGMKTIEEKSAPAGEIVCLAGFEHVQIGDTLAADKDEQFLDPIKIDEPTLSVVIGHNTSPLSGRDGGRFLTSRQVRDRLLKEARNNIGFKVEDSQDASEGMKVSGRGELHLTILIETLRREGYEIEVSKPHVILKQIDGQTMEPYQDLMIEVEKQYQGFVIEELGMRKAIMENMAETDQETIRFDYVIPDRTLLGFRSEFVTATKGTGIMHHIFKEYRPLSGQAAQRSKGVLISQCPGKAVGYALNGLQERGELFIGVQTPVYEGMLVGVNNKGADLTVNAIKEKKLTNMRAAGSDDAIALVPPRIMTIEWALDFIAEDELLEVTPLNLRLRKKILTENERKRSKPKTH